MLEINTKISYVSPSRNIDYHYDNNDHKYVIAYLETTKRKIHDEWIDLQMCGLTNGYGDNRFQSK